MSFDYNFDSFTYDSLPSGAESVLSIILVIYGVIALLAMAFSIVSYVLHSVGMYTMAKRRGIRHPWLAWIPVGNMWLLGSIADQYQYVAKGKVRNRRKILLGVMIAMYVLMIPMGIGYAGLIFDAFSGTAASGVLFGSLMLIISSLLILVAELLGVIFQYIAYHNLFTSSDPNNAVAFLIVGIFIPVTLPFFVFACRKKDLGMPPRKQEQPPVAPQPELLQEPETTPEPMPEAKPEDFVL